MSLISALLRNTWMIDEQFAIGISPLLQNVVSGKKVSFENLALKATEMRMDTHGESNHNDQNINPTKQIAYLAIQGVLTKNDYCGEMGLKSMDAKIKEYTADDSVGAILLEFDTPGGEASFLPIIAQTIRDARSMKPVIGFVNGGMCASAGYYLLSQCSFAYVSSETDIVGSIGTMIQLVSEGTKTSEDYIIHTINATKSIDKNKPFMEALKGKYELIRSEILDPMNEVFLSNVKLGRPTISNDVFTGKTYMLPKAMELNMVDGQKTFDEVIQFTSSLIENPQNAPNMKFNLFSRNKPEQQMKNERISAILGRDFHDGDALSAEDNAKIVQALDTPAVAQLEAIESPVMSIAEQQEAIANSVAAAVTAAINPISESVAALAGRLDAVEKKPAAGAAVETVEPIAGADAVDYSDKPWLDPNNPIALATKAALGL